MIEPLFTSKLRYGLALIADASDEDDRMIKQLHLLHRRAMKAALRLGQGVHLSDRQLLEKTGQMPVREIAACAVANMAWRCGKDWKGNGLMGTRLENHSNRCTRQRTQRSFPPQSNIGSLPHKLVEMWEQMPDNIKIESCPEKAFKAIKQWITSKD